MCYARLGVINVMANQSPPPFVAVNYVSMDDGWSASRSWWKRNELHTTIISTIVNRLMTTFSIRNISGECVERAL